MLCGLTRLVSRIKMMLYTHTHPGYHCKALCLFCQFFENCYYDKEHIEEVFGEPFE